MKTKFILRQTDYDGSQLVSGFAKKTAGISGDSIVAFVGRASVKDHMVDIEDKRKKEFIFSDRMLHFIIEHFDKDLEKAVLRKRLFLSIILDSIKTLKNTQNLCRLDNGIYDGTKKLTVAVATFSPVSTLMHIGLNITNTGTPIEVACLNDWAIDANKFALDMMKRYNDEMVSARRSTKKVKGVR